LNPQRVLERIPRLLKPGGWLLVEEGIIMMITGEITGDAPAVRAALVLLCKYWDPSGQVPRVGGKLESWLRQAGAFGEVNVHKVITPVGKPSSPSSAAATAATRNLFSTRDE